MMLPEAIKHVEDQQRTRENENLLQIDYHNVKKASLILRSLNHKLRQQIIKTINDAEKLTVTELYVKLRLEQSVASQHLAILRKTGVVLTRREGKFIFYTINAERLKSIDKFTNELIG